MRSTLVTCLLLAAACSSAPPTSPLIVARPYDLHVPKHLDASKPAPLVVLLHGYMASGFLQEALFQMSDTADAHGFLYAMPDGTVDGAGNHFWNATDACCDAFKTHVDDLAYLNALVDDVAAKHKLDLSRVYFIGHSNGGFMAHRMACDASSRVAAIMALAGVTYLDPARCAAASPVAVLQVHGTADDTVPFDGRATPLADDLAPFPGAVDTVSRAAAKNGCGALADSGERIDLDSHVAGAETEVWRAPACTSGFGAELWKMDGSGHLPGLMPPDWGERVWGWLSQFSRPQMQR